MYVSVSHVCTGAQRRVSDHLELGLHAINCEAQSTNQKPNASLLEEQQVLSPQSHLSSPTLIMPLFSPVILRFIAIGAATELSGFILHLRRLAGVEKRQVLVTGPLCELCSSIGDSRSILSSFAARPSTPSLGYNSFGDFSNYGKSSWLMYTCVGSLVVR